MMYYSFFLSHSNFSTLFFSFLFLITWKGLKGTSVFQIFIEDSQAPWSWFTFLYHAVVFPV